MSKRRGTTEADTEGPGAPDPDKLELRAYGYIMAHARNNPLRTGATITAVAVAVAFLIIVGSISVGLEGAEKRELLDYTLGTPQLPISDFIQTQEGDFVGLFATTLFDADDREAIRFTAQQFVGSVEGAKTYPYSERELGATPFTGLQYHVQRLLAVDPGKGLTTAYTHYHTYLELAIGEHLDDIDAGQVVLGYRLWKDRFPDAHPGDTIELSPDGPVWLESTAGDLRSRDPLTLTRLPALAGLRLQGVLDRDSATDDNAYVPLGMFADATGAGRTAEGPRCEAISVEVKAGDVDMDALADRLVERSGRVTSLYVSSLTAPEHEALAKSLDTAIYSWLVLAVAVILVGMLLGIANTSFLTVSQRVREVGTLRALGLSRDQVRKLIQWEALFIGMMGWIIGFFAGLILSSNILNVIYEVGDLGLLLAPGRTPPFLVVGSAVAVIVASLVGAELPARRASAMSPTEALSAPL